MTGGINEKVNYVPLTNAIKSLEKAINKYNELGLSEELKEYLRDSVIQRFEFTFELAWKTLRRYLEVFMLEQVDQLVANDLFRIGFESGLIQNPVLWMGFKKSRNLTSHTYNIKTADVVFMSAKEFLIEAQYFLKKLEEKLGAKTN